MATRLLITGSTGFVGGYVTGQLREANPLAEWEIRLWSKESDGDLQDPANLRSLVKRWRPDVLLQLAWATTGTSTYESDAANDSWLSTSVDIVRICQENGIWLVGLGSGVEQLTDARFSSRYRNAKLGAREFALSGLPIGQVTWCRPYWIFSVPDARPRVVRSLLEASQRGECFTPTEPAMMLDFIHVEDVASALLTVLRSRLTGIVDIASGSLHSVEQLLCGAELVAHGVEPSVAALSTEVAPPSGIDISPLQRSAWSAEATDAFFSALSRRVDEGSVKDQIAAGADRIQR
jgi:nucleoside-diphosphate-sugar epimerase